MKSNVSEVRRQLPDVLDRIDVLDSELAELDARIEKNRAELEHNNEEIQSRIAKLCLRMGVGV